MTDASYAVLLHGEHVGVVAHTPEPVAEWIDTHLAGTRQRLLGR